MIQTYKLSQFGVQAAMSGALCVIVNKGYSSGTIKTDNTNFVGAGLCVEMKNGTYQVSYNSVAYLYNNNGDPANSNASNTVLKIGALKTADTVVTQMKAGNLIQASWKAETTRSADGTEKTEVTSGEDSYNIDYLNARDEFAVKVLQGLLTKMDDSVGVSDAVRSHYCDAAYSWAANMMVAAANARAEFKDSTATSNTSTVSVGSLDNNTDRLLNNIVASLQRDDMQSLIQAHWSKEGYADQVGLYTDEQAALLPHAEGTPAYTTIGEAEADDWVWTAKTTHRQRTFVESDIIKELVQTEQRTDLKEANTYYKRIENPHLTEWLNKFIVHIPEPTEPETKTTIGLDDIMKTIRSGNAAIEGRLQDINETLITFNNSIVSVLEDIAAAIREGHTPTNIPVPE